MTLRIVPTTTKYAPFRSHPAGIEAKDRERACVERLSSSLSPPATPLASTTDLSYDTHYDDPSLALSGVTCSDGDNGMITKGYNTAGEIPNYPHVGGAFTVETWNSPNCGKCYKVTYNAKTIFLTAIDHSNSGFNIAKKSMDVLTNGRAEELGRIKVTYEEVASSLCGLK
ncbi:allergen Asp f 15 [Coccidioides immitis RMSCC 3703]|uniref:Allergen Asp f 15 n=1 Tax=Coccidioides immitis RMSCC 3703 TaxID=454286 RepID=A0A0J8QSS2_COCIT|nr:allergen Asp f 15 [Coccidioides immitis RMSCC 3703]